MRFSVAAVVAFAASVSAVAYGNNGTDFTTTKVVTSYTTYCPGPTSIVENGKTYTVTTATTLTITDCPCTLTYTYTSAPPATSAAETPAETPEAPVYPVPTGTGSPLPPANVTEPAPTYAAPSPSETTFEGAGNRVTVAGGALVGLLGAVAFLL